MIGFAGALPILRTEVTALYIVYILFFHSSPLSHRLKLPQDARWGQGGREMADIGLWIGIALSIPLSILANILTPRLLSYLERRKVLKTTKTRQQEQLIFDRTRAFKSGKRDRYAFYFVCAASAIFCMIAASALFVLMCILPMTLDNILVCAAIAVVTLGLALSLILGIHITSYNIENFEDYEQRLRERWPVCRKLFEKRRECVSLPPNSKSVMTRRNFCQTKSIASLPYEFDCLSSQRLRIAQDICWG